MGDRNASNTQLNILRNGSAANFYADAFGKNIGDYGKKGSEATYKLGYLKGLDDDWNGMTGKAMLEAETAQGVRPRNGMIGSQQIYDTAVRFIESGVDKILVEHILGLMGVDGSEDNGYGELAQYVTDELDMEELKEADEDKYNALKSTFLEHYKDQGVFSRAIILDRLNTQNSLEDILNR